MVQWTILGIKTKKEEEYKDLDYNSEWRETSLRDLIDVVHDDDRVKEMKYTNGHLYMYLATSECDYKTGEKLLEDFSGYADCAFILTANSTTNTGVARYYDDPENPSVDDLYEESQSEDGLFTGKKALQNISVENNIFARDPFHNFISDATPLVRNNE